MVLVLVLVPVLVLVRGADSGSGFDSGGWSLVVGCIYDGAGGV